MPTVFRKSNRTTSRKTVHTAKGTNNIVLGVCKTHSTNVLYSNVQSANIDLDNIIDDITLEHTTTLERLAK